MLDDHYPTIDISFLDSIFKQCENVVDVIETAQSKAYILEGKKPMTQRIITIRDTGDGQLAYLQATGIAARLKCMGKLLDWLVVNRNWKDGAYVTLEADKKDVDLE